MKTYCKHCGVVITQIGGQWKHGPEPLGNYYILCRAQVAEPLEAVTSPGVYEALLDLRGRLDAAIATVEVSQ